LKFSCSEDMAAACSQAQSRNDMPSSPGADDPGDIPKEIPLNQEQEDKFFSKMWAAFVMSGVASIALTVTFGILRVLFRR